MKCRYPGCTQQACKTFALVPLCELHEETIRAETQHYYEVGSSGKLSKGYAEMRPLYLKIARLIPWARKKGA